MFGVVISIRTPILIVDEWYISFYLKETNLWRSTPVAETKDSKYPRVSSCARNILQETTEFFSIISETLSHQKDSRESSG